MSASEERIQALRSESLKRDLIVSFDEVDDPWEAGRQCTREFWIRQILLYRKLAEVSTPRDETRRDQIIEYMDRLVILAILRNPSLAARLDSQAHSSVTEFVASAELSVEELEALAHTFISTPLQVVFHAIMDIFRSDGNHDTVLGRKIYSTISDSPVPFRAWELLQDVENNCPYEVHNICPSLSDWLTLQNTTTMGGAFRDWEWPPSPTFNEVECIFRFCRAFVHGRYKLTKHDVHVSVSEYHEAELPAGMMIMCEDNDIGNKFIALLIKLKAIYRVIAWRTDAANNAFPLDGDLRTEDYIWTRRYRVAARLGQLKTAKWITDIVEGPPAKILAEDFPKFPNNTGLHIFVMSSDPDKSYDKFADSIASVLIRANYGAANRGDAQRLAIRQWFSSSQEKPWGFEKESFASVTCGCIHTTETPFHPFLKTCNALTQILVNEDMVSRWEKKEHFTRILEAMDSWQAFGAVIDRMGLFYKFFVSEKCCGTLVPRRKSSTSQDRGNYSDLSTTEMKDRLEESIRARQASLKRTKVLDSYHRVAEMMGDPLPPDEKPILDIPDSVTHLQGILDLQIAKASGDMDRVKELAESFTDTNGLLLETMFEMGFGKNKGGSTPEQVPKDILSG
ncbi:hypothetical protein BDZ94DRAFT_1249801 [Collybia nuda]|uniref:Uncharacterized protein n=1 Tax=Collybia nuda TaxID=64659 RepID=A0A9P5YE42_9AGAR|nr:hypothetical protein BDZ94DRAFT_1249801 [Collybia nuda]